MVESLYCSVVVAVTQLLLDEPNMIENVVGHERFFVCDVLLFHRSSAVRLD